MIDKKNDEHRYDDIINLPYPVSKVHPQMPLIDRAAQFSPFAALTGYEAAIDETARLTEDFIELDENKKEQLNEQLQQIKRTLDERRTIRITYFMPDEQKCGGAYVTVNGVVKRIGEHERLIHMEDGTIIPIDRIFNIDCMDK